MAFEKIDTTPDLGTLEALAAEAEAGDFDVSELGGEDWTQKTAEIFAPLTVEPTEQSVNPTSSDASASDSATAEAISRRLAEVMVADVALGGALSTQVADLQRLIIAVQTGQPIAPGALEVTFASIQDAVYAAQTGGSLKAADKTAAQRQTAQAIQDMIAVQKLETQAMRDMAAYYISQGYNAETVIDTINDVNAFLEEHDIDASSSEGLAITEDFVETTLSAQQASVTMQVLSMASDNMTAEQHAAFNQRQEEAQGLRASAMENSPAIQAYFSERDAMGSKMNLVEVKLLQNLAEGRIDEATFIEQSRAFVESYKPLVMHMQEVQIGLLSDGEKGAVERYASKQGVDLDKHTFLELMTVKEAIAIYQEVYSDTRLDDPNLTKAERDALKAEIFEALPAAQQDALVVAGQTIALEGGTQFVQQFIDVRLEHYVANGHSLEEATVLVVGEIDRLADPNTPESQKRELLANGNMNQTQQDAALNTINRSEINLDYGVVSKAVTTVAATKGVLNTDVLGAELDKFRTFKENYKAHNGIDHKKGEVDDLTLALAFFDQEHGALGNLYGVADHAEELRNTRDSWLHPQNTDFDPDGVDERISEFEAQRAEEGRLAVIAFNKAPEAYGPDSKTFIAATGYTMQLEEGRAMQLDPSLRMEAGHIHPTKSNEIYDSVTARFTRRHEEARLQEVQKMLDMEPAGQSKVSVTENGTVTVAGSSPSGEGGMSVGTLEGTGVTDAVQALADSGVTMQSTPAAPNTGLSYRMNANPNVDELAARATEAVNTEIEVAAADTDAPAAPRTPYAPPTPNSGISGPV